MKIEMNVPELGESVQEAEVGRLLKESGSYVAMDEEVIELETEKVNQVLTAPQAGVIEFVVKPEDTVAIGQLLATIDTEAEGAAAPAAPTSEPAAEPAPATPAPAPAKSVGVREPMESFLSAPAPAPAAAPAPAPSPAKKASVGDRDETRTNMPKIRRTIARRLVEAQQETAMLTTFNEVDMSAVMELRSKHRDEFLERFGVKLGFMSFFVKAVVAALKEVPDVNSRIDGNEVVHPNFYDVGIAVGTDRGLVVPVVRDCDQLSFAGIEGAIADYAGRARGGTLQISDMEGGSFTITNGGIYGSLLSTPILNRPQSGILGMHAIQKRPVVVDDEVVVRPMMYLALSYDHRIVDGKGAVTFLVHVKENLEDPARLLLDLWQSNE